MIRADGDTIQTNCIGTTFDCMDNAGNRNGIVLESGADIFKHRKIWWMLGFALVTFLFAQTQLNPKGAFVGAFNRPNMMALIVATALFCLISGGLWLCFWDRDRRARG